MKRRAYCNHSYSRDQIEKNLQYFLEPKYNIFLDRIHQLPNGLKFLADMRADLLVRQTSLCGDDIGLFIYAYVAGFDGPKRECHIQWIHQSRTRYSTQAQEICHWVSQVGKDYMGKKLSCIAWKGKRIEKWQASPLTWPRFVPMKQCIKSRIGRISRDV